MKIQLSTLSRDPLFAKAVRRIRPNIQSVLDHIEGTELTNPTWTTLLVGITDDLAPGTINELPHEDGSLQLTVGVSEIDDWSPANDRNLHAMIMDIIKNTLDRCELTPDDRSRLENCLK